MTCSTDYDCSHLLLQNKCLASQGCVQCLSDSDCSYGTQCTNNVCADLPLSLKTKGTSSPNVYILNLPSQALVTSNIQDSLSIELVGIDPNSYNYAIYEVSSDQYAIEFTPLKSIPSSTLKIIYTLPSSTGSLAGLARRLELDILIKRMPFITFQQNKAAQDTKTAGTAVVISMAAASAIMILISSNPLLLWSLVNLMQAFYYLVFVNVNLPANVQEFFKLFNVGQGSFIPNPVDLFVPDLEDQSLPAPPRYEEYDVDGLFLANAGNMLLIWFAVFVIYVIAAVYVKFFHKLSKRITTGCEKLVGWFRWSGVLRAFITSYPELTQAAFLQLLVMNFDSGLFAVSSIFGVIFTGFAAILPFTTWLIIRKCSDDEAKFESRYGALVEEYAFERVWPKYFTTVLLVRRLLTCLSLVYLQDWPYVQISCLLMISFAILIAIIKYQPYASKWDNRVNIIYEVLFFLVQVLFLVLINDDYHQNYSEQDRLDIGWAIVGVCSASLLTGLVVSICEEYKALKEFSASIKKLINKIKHKGKKTEEIDKKLAQVYPQSPAESHFALSPSSSVLTPQSSRERYEKMHLNSKRVSIASQQENEAVCLTKDV